METTANDAPFSAESYFATQPPPPELDEAIQGVKEFLDRNLKAGRKVVLRYHPFVRWCYYTFWAVS
jgi:phosphopantothenate-cysteine ligase